MLFTQSQTVNEITINNKLALKIFWYKDSESKIEIKMRKGLMQQI